MKFQIVQIIKKQANICNMMNIFLMQEIMKNMKIFKLRQCQEIFMFKLL